MPQTPTVVYNQNFSTSAGTGGPRINIDYRMQLIQQRESAAPFLALMLHINSEGTQTYQFNNFETRPNPKKAIVNASGTAAGTVANTVQITLATASNATFFNINNIVIAKTAVAGSGQTVVGIVTALDTTNGYVTVKPNDPTKAFAAVPGGDELQVWGNSQPQGATSANPTGTQPKLNTFYTQIFKDSYQVNRTQANNRLYGAPERDRLRSEREIDHLMDIERALLRGDGIVDTSYFSDPRTTLSGLLNQIQSNVLSYGANLTTQALFNFMTTVHAPKYAPDGKQSRRMVLASADVMAAINNIALATRRELQVATVFGVDVSKLVWAGRTWDFIEHPILSDVLPGWAVVFHPRYVKLREFRPTRLEANIQANDADYYKDQFLTELGLEVQLEELHGVMHP